MGTEQVAFKAEPRTSEKKSDLTRLRSEGFIPAVVYSKGAPGETVKLNAHDFKMMLKHHSGENLMIDLEIAGGESRHVLIKDIQHHPMNADILHVDFHEIRLDRLIKVLVPLELTGKPIGVSQGGGTLDVHQREIEVECKAMDLVDSIPVDISGLKIGDQLLVEEVKLPEGYELLTPTELSVATVLKPRVATTEEEEEEAAAGEESAESGEEPSEDKDEDSKDS